MKTLLALSLVAVLAVAGCTDGLSASGAVPDPPDPKPGRPLPDFVAVQIFIAGDCPEMRSTVRIANGDEGSGQIHTGQWITAYYAPHFLPATITIRKSGNPAVVFGPTTITRDTVMIWRCS